MEDDATPRAGKRSEDDRLPGLPRYVRINTIKMSIKAAHRECAQAGYQLSPEPNPAGNRCYFRDDIVPDLMVFKPKGKSDISRLPLVATGEVVIQQKASCFPALALHPPPGAVVIDGCAAPGNKTCHLAALMQNRGEVIAFERDERRCELLKRMMVLKGASIVRSVHGSFLDASPDDPAYARVTHVLLDPSCSSSGMSKTPFTDPAEIRELAAAQAQLILHAMKFPALQELSYSTCSIYEEENERVVAAVLAAQPAAARKGTRRFGLAAALPAWHRRGHVLDSLEPALAQQIARCCVRTAYPDDATIGFFLAKFVVEGTEPAKPSPELQVKLDALARARTKQSRAAPAAAPAAAAAREVPAWRRERDERLKEKRQRKE
jgi:putative methyltransferase